MPAPLEGFKAFDHVYTRIHRFSLPVATANVKKCCSAVARADSIASTLVAN